MDRSVLDVLAVAAACALALIFVIAAVAKVRSKASTIADFESLGLPRPHTWATVIPLLELATAALLIANPGWGGVTAFALLVGFTTNLWLVIRSGRVASCACFGGSSATPVSARHLARNAVLLGLAGLAALFDGWIWSL